MLEVGNSLGTELNAFEGINDGIKLGSSHGFSVTYFITPVKTLGAKNLEFSKNGGKDATPLPSYIIKSSSSLAILPSIVPKLYRISGVSSITIKDCI